MAAKQTDIAIIGAGAGGLSLACLLGQAGLTVALIDPKAPTAPKGMLKDGRTVALMHSSINVLKAIGVWDGLAPISGRLAQMRICDTSMSNQEAIDIDFPASDIGLDEFGFNIPIAHLRSALFKKAKDLKTITFVEDYFDSYRVEGQTAFVRLKSGKEIKAALVVGADGRKSSVRACAQIDIQTQEYGQSAMTFLINHSKAHQNTSTEFHRPGGPIALVPLPANQCSVVWVEKTARAEELIRLKKSEFETVFQRETQNLLGGVTLESGIESWPLSSLKAKSLTAPRMALVAEAAHAMSPITAQGLNLSLRDVATLSESIVDHARLGLDIGTKACLDDYAKRRRLDIETRVFGVDTLNKIVASDITAFKQLRRIGLKALEAPLPFKTLAMHVGLAPKIDQGRILKGEAL